MPGRTNRSRRKHDRVEFKRPGFVVLEPGGPWMSCAIIDVSHNGACIKVGDLALPRVFLLLMSSNGDVRRTCTTVWRRGDLAGVQFVTSKQGLDDLIANPD